MEVLEALIWSPGFVLGVLGIILAVLVWVLMRSLGRARDAASYTPLGEDGDGDLDFVPVGAGGKPAEGDGLHLLDFRGPARRADLERTFRRVEELTEGGETGRVPWFLCVGAAGAGKSTLLAHSDLRLPFGEPRPGAPGETPPACDTWIFDRAVVLDVAGDLVLPEAGVSADRAGWVGLLNALVAERPQRPADGMVLTLAGNELLAAAAGDATALRLLGRRADRLRSRLEEAQKILGFDLPVSVVLTKADLIPGFPDLQATLPEEQRQQIFGWSTPYPPTTTYSGSWPDDAVDSLHEFLVNQQARVLAAGTPLAAPRSYLALPATVDALKGPLRTVLNRIFAGGPGPATPPFRGLYMTAGHGFPGRHRAAAQSGVGAEGDAAGESAGESGDAHRRVDFVSDLLAEKVFSDWDLARPDPEELERRERTRRISQVAVALLLVVAPIAMLINAWHLSEEADVLRDSFVVPAIKAVQACPNTSATATTPCVPHTLSLLDSAAVVPDYRLRPAAFIGDLTECVTRLATLAYERVVFPTLHAGLDQRADRIVDQPVDPQTAVIYDLPTVQAYRALNGMMDSLDELETQAGYYNRYVGADTCWSSNQETVTYFDDLTRYLLATPFTLPTADAVGFYGQVLCEARPQPYDPTTRVTTMDARVEQLSALMFRNLYTGNAIVLDLAALEAGIARLAADPPAPAAAEARYEELIQLIDRTQEDLADPRLAWAAQDTPQLGPSYDSLLSSITSSRWTGLDTAREVHRQASSGLTRMRQGLADASTQATGPLLARKGTEVLLRLSPSVLSLRAALATLLGQYLRPVGDLGWTVVPASGTYLSWNPAPLSAAADLMDGYDTFVQTQLDAFPSLRPGVDQSTRDRVEREALAIAAQGQSFPPRPSLAGTRQIEDHLSQRVANLQAAGEPLNRLLTDFRSPGFPASCTPSTELPYCLLAQALAVQEVGMVDLLDRLLTAQALYHPAAGGFSGWKGQGSLAWSAFGVASAKELEAYVASQRNTVTGLNDRYATPIFTTVPVPDSILPSTPEPVARWTLLRSDLEAYKAKTAGNPLATLEGFILGPMAEATLPTCLDVDPTATSCLPAGAQGQTGTPSCDYFLDARNQLLLASAATCEDVTLTAGGAAWGGIADQFTAELAGRYPFADGTASGGGDPTPPDATPAGLASFYATYDAVRPAVGRSLQVTADLRRRDPGSLPTAFGIAWPQPDWSTAQAAEVTTFLDRMDGVRTFFDPFLTAWAAAGPKKPKPVPTFGLGLDLSPAPASEAGGSQVLRRSLAINGNLARVSGPPPAPRQAPLTWSYGSTLTVTLEWARDGWYQPETVVANPYGRVVGNRVTYRYPEPWSLLHFLQGPASCPAASPGDSSDGDSSDGNSSAGNSGAPRPGPTVGDLVAFCVDTRRQPPPTPPEAPQRWSRPAPVEPGTAPEEPTRAELLIQAVPQTAADPRVTVSLPTFPTRAPTVPVPAAPGITLPVPDASPQAEPEPDGTTATTLQAARTASLGGAPEGR